MEDCLMVWGLFLFFFVSYVFFLFFLSLTFFVFFLATKLLHEVCLKNLHRVLSGIRREKHCYYTINCISFLGHQELFRDRLKCGIISTTMKFETYA